MEIFSDPQKIPGSLETLLAESFFGTGYIVLFISCLPFEIMNESLSFGLKTELFLKGKDNENTKFRLHLCSLCFFLFLCRKSSPLYLCFAISISLGSNKRD